MYEDLSIEEDPRLEPLLDFLDQFDEDTKDNMSFYMIVGKKHWSKDENGEPYFVQEFMRMDNVEYIMEKENMVEAIIKEDPDLEELKNKKVFFVN